MSQGTLMRHIHITSVLALFTFLVLWTMPSHASTNLQTNSYELFEITGDVPGIDDELYYLQSVEEDKTIILPFDGLVIPIVVDAPENLIIKSDGSIVEWPAEIAAANLLAIDSLALLGDFNGDGIEDLLFKSNVPSYENLVVFGDAGNAPTSANSFTQVEGFDLYGREIEVVDLNSDGKDDLVIKFSDGAQVSALAKTGGTFNSTRGGVTQGTTVPGAIAGDFSVGKDGSANYSIPIAVPPGGAGMHPTLSFTYNSGGGNGYMGMGWDVTQPSAISKCSTTFIDDGYIEADKYWCLDGQRMVEVSANTFMLANTNFSKIEKISGRDAFKVYFKSGELGYFGNYDGNNPNAHDTNMDVLHLAKIEDRASNKREYDYYFNASSGEHYLAEITYPGGEITFNYSSAEREDRSIGWKNGKKSQILKTLESVISQVEGQVYRTYELEYQFDTLTKKKLLSSMRECGAAGACLLPTIFDWSNPGSGQFADSTGAPQFDYYQDYIGYWNQGYSRYPGKGHKFLDVNGDGLTDVIQNNQGKRTTGTTHYTIPNFHILINQGNNEFEYNHIFTAAGEWSQWTAPIDMDGDGKTEFLVPGGNYRNPDINADLILWRYDEESDGYRADVPGKMVLEGLDLDYKANYLYSVGDIDGNGLPDLLQGHEGTLRVNLNLDGTKFESAINTDVLYPNESRKETIVIDIDGDGKQELLVPIDGEWHVFESYIVNESQLKFRSRALGIDASNPQYFNFADLNGDGLTELLFKDENENWAFYLNTGGDFLNIRSTSFEHSGDARIFDYDDDGADDIVFLENDQIHYLSSKNISACVFSNTNSCFEKINTNVTLQVDDNEFYFGDFDGDGLSDLFGWHNGERVISLREPGELPNYLQTVTNGFGLATEFSYGLIYDRVESSDFYEKGDLGVFPQINLSGALNVVRKVSTLKDGQAYKDEITYDYKRFMTYAQGLGGAGFEMVVSTTPYSKVATTYSSDWQNRVQGMPLEQTSYKRQDPTSSMWTEVGKVSYQHKSVLTSGVQELAIRHTFLKSTLEESRSLAGALLKITETEYEYDTEEAGFDAFTDFGNNLEVQISTYTPSMPESPAHVVTTKSSYDSENYANWLIGKVTKSEATHSAPGQDDIKKVSSWSYYPDGYLESETIEPDSSDQNTKQTKTYFYNSKGLVEREVISVTNSAYSDRETMTVYDSYGRLPVTIVSEIGTTNFSYDPVLGLLTSKTDLNGNTSKKHYDGFGRITSEIGADGTFIKTSFHQLEASTNIKSKFYESLMQANGGIALHELPAQYYIEKLDQNGAWVKTYYDRLGNSFHVRKLDGLGHEIRADVEYDKYGRVLRSSEPYFASSSSKYWSQVKQRDALHRAIKTINPEGGESQTIYDGLKTTYINEKGQVKTELMTITGKTYQIMNSDNRVVEYRYNAFGNVTDIIDLVDIFPSLPASGNDPTNDIKTTNIYDRLGRKVSTNDPNKGQWRYTYNAFGELVMQEDAEGNLTCQVFDTSGRMVKRIDNYQGTKQQALAKCDGDHANPETTVWMYDTATNGLGKLDRILGPNNYSEVMIYDSLGRPKEVIKTIAGQTFTTATTYDGQSRPATSTYPSGLAITNVYDTFGALKEIRKAGNDQYYWKLNSLNHRGQAEDVSLANGAMTTQSIYTNAMGRLESIETTTGLLTNPVYLQQNSAIYDELGSVMYRENLVTQSSETAFYDHLNRLEHIDRVVNGIAMPRESMSYEYNGNIKTKWDIAGQYQYGQACSGVTPGPHAVTQAGGNNYCYDKNGNVINSGDRTIEWASFGKPIRISRGNNVAVDFEYGPDRARIKRVDSNSQGVTTTLYIGGYEKISRPNGTIEERHMIGGVVSVNIETQGTNSTTSENYLLKDTLGSVISSVDLASLGSVAGYDAEQTAFDSWGMRRNSDWTAMSTAELYSYKSSVTDRGFTGHEHIDEVGLVHMNGRVYDPVIGRFMSADPFVTDPTDLQSFNRYSYVRNNPLTVTDPTGYFDFIDDFISPIAETIVTGGFNLSFHAADKGLREFGRFARKNKYVAEVTQIAGCIATAAIGIGPSGCAAVSASVTYGVTDGDYRATAKAAAVAYATASVAMKFGAGIDASTWMGKMSLVINHGMLGGTVSISQGGRFEHGFAAGAFGKAAGFALQSFNLPLYAQGQVAGSFQHTDWHHIAARTTIAAIIGGTASELSGGVFANGARTAAIQHLFNFELEAEIKAITQDYIEQQKLVLAKALQTIGENITGRFSAEIGVERCFFTCVGFSLEGNLAKQLTMEATIGGAGFGFEPAGAINFSMLSLGDDLPEGRAYGQTEVEIVFFLGVSGNHKYWTESGRAMSSFELELKLSSGVTVGSKTGLGGRIR